MFRPLTKKMVAKHVCTLLGTCFPRYSRPINFCCDLSGTLDKHVNSIYRDKIAFEWSIKIFEQHGCDNKPTRYLGHKDCFPHVLSSHGGAGGLCGEERAMPRVPSTAVGQG